MPSPLGHALAGIAAAWSADLVPGRREWRIGPDDASWYRRAGGGMTLACAFLGAIPDVDLLLGGHRTYSHSVAAVAAVGLCAALVAAAVRLPIARVTAMCTAAYATHLILDWLGVDPTPPFGIQALWPFSNSWFLSGLGLFAPTERRHFLVPSTFRANTLAVTQEVVILAPVLVSIWLVRIKALAGLAPEVACCNHAAK